MHMCKDCDHLMVCKFTDSGDGRCQKPQHFRNKRQSATELEKTKALLAKALADLRRADIDCLMCIHKVPAAPCNSDEKEVYCDDCPHDCYCKDCYNNSKWEWAGAPTNADRIRALSDETLAEKLYDIWRNEVERGHDLAINWCHSDCCFSEDCCPEKHKACILRWLQSPVKEGPQWTNCGKCGDKTKDI